MGRAPHKKALSRDTAEDFQIVEDSLRRVNMLEFRDRSFLTLSGGEKQKVCLARAIVNHPTILLADEPTGNLDSKTSEDVLFLLKSTGIRFHQTIVMITHNDAIAKTADRIIRIEDGRIKQ